MRMDFLFRLITLGAVCAVLAAAPGCAIWPMLPRESVQDPIGAFGGVGVVYAPPVDFGAMQVEELRTASSDQLIEYYAPIIVQQHQIPGEDKFQWPVETDSIGSPYLVVGPKGKLKTKINTQLPTVYVHHERRQLGNREHLQITYTLWYPRHPRTKTVDIEAAEVDSGIMRITLDDNNTPILYETVLACGCYHKVFVEHWVEDAARQHFGEPEQGKSTQPNTKFLLHLTGRSPVQFETNETHRFALRSS